MPVVHSFFDHTMLEMEDQNSQSPHLSCMLEWRSRDETQGACPLDAPQRRKLMPQSPSEPSPPSYWARQGPVQRDTDQPRPRSFRQEIKIHNQRSCQEPRSSSASQMPLGAGAGSSAANQCLEVTVALRCSFALLMRTGSLPTGAHKTPSYPPPINWQHQ